MSYYGPASQTKTKRRLPQYDYGKHHHHPREYDYISLSRAGNFNRHNKRLRKTVRPVPWRDEWELQAVGNALLSVLQQYNNNNNNNNTNCNQVLRDDDREEPPPVATSSTTTTMMSPEEAFAMISVWKARLIALEGLPHAIESTAALAQVYWRDSQRRIQRSTMVNTTTTNYNHVNVSVSVTELRLAYSAAIVRCINGFADSLQQQRAMAASVANLCGQLGIPSWLVDTRHESSHNALPNIEVLRLSATTLLEFMQSEYWIPRCSKDWKNDNDDNETTIMTGATTVATATARSGESDNNNNYKNRSSPIDCLLDYTVCASTWDTTRAATSSNDTETTKSKKGTPTASLTPNKRKKKAPSVPQKTIILPYDPLFGEVGTLSSDDGEDDDDGDDDDDDNNVDKPVVNSIWGSSIGTSTNRYLLLEIPKTKKKKGKDKEKNKKKEKAAIQNTPKKRKGEKSPNDCAKLFVQSVSSPQEGYEIATQYLIWGGVGGAPMGRGILIPESENTFPATPQGVSKCWQRYSPLIHVISRTWPGFAACMITHLVDCVLSIEDSAAYNNINDNDNHHQCNDHQQEQLVDAVDAGSTTRKLYFLFAWIRLILSQRFVAALDRTFSVKHTTTKNTNALELPLAQLKHLESLGYPLNSLLDRCRRRCNDQHRNNNNSNSNSDDDDGDGDGDGDDNNKKSSSSIAVVDSHPMKTSRDIIQSLETILGAKKTYNFGYFYGMAGPETTLALQEIHNISVGPSLLQHAPEERNGDTIADAKRTSGAMSLDEMEAMLLSDNNSTNNDHEVVVETKAESNNVGYNDAVKTSANQPLKETSMEESEILAPPPKRRSAWIRCERWDACAIGTLPGYPS